MTGTSFIDVFGVAIVVLLSVAGSVLFLGILGTFVYAIWASLTQRRTPDHRQYGPNPGRDNDWPL